MAADHSHGSPESLAAGGNDRTSPTKNEWDANQNQVHDSNKRASTYISIVLQHKSIAGILFALFNSALSRLIRVLRHASEIERERECTNQSIYHPKENWTWYWWTRSKMGAKVV
mmetsp:Transcript_24806/g.68681  ORF Transcript_24806/g.68681 Transcript_24806/m.68681 type:complete len:114 (-) Transcript_24806:135-476(-)